MSDHLRCSQCFITFPKEGKNDYQAIFLSLLDRQVPVLGVNMSQQTTKAVFLNFDEMMDESISTSIEEYVRGEIEVNDPTNDKIPVTPTKPEGTDDIILFGKGNNHWGLSLDSDW